MRYLTERMNEKEAQEEIYNMRRLASTGDEMIALEMAGAALGKQQRRRRIMIEGRMCCPVCRNPALSNGFCMICGQKIE